MAGHHEDAPPDRIQPPRGLGGCSKNGMSVSVPSAVGRTSAAAESDRFRTGLGQEGLKGARQASPDYFTASILVTASSPCSLSRLPVTLTFLVWLQISPWKPLETSPVSL